MATTAPASSALVQQGRPPWVHRNFLKDAKIRVQERYWRPVEKIRDSEARWTVVPDAIVWRRYLKLLLHLIDQEPTLQWIFLESAAELLDWRNSSPCLETENDVLIKEAAALQERSKIRKCVEEHAENVHAFCDLSIREKDGDEWQLLDYPDMSVQDRSRHALFRAGSFLTASSSHVVLLVNDKESTSNDNENLQVFDVAEFLEFYGRMFPNVDMEELLNVKRVCEETYRQRNSPEDTADHRNVELTEEQVQDGLRSCTLVRGRLEVTKANPKDAFVSAGKDRYFINLESNNFCRALHHDVVVIQPLPESQWDRPVGRRRLVHVRTEDDEGPEVEMGGPTVPSASVVSVVATSRREFVATLVDEPTGDERAVLVVPYDIRIPKIRIQSRGWPTFVNQRLLVEIDAWEAGSTYPSGHCVKIIGPVANLETEIECLLYEHEIQLEPFSANALACLPPEGPQWTIPTSEVEGRLDLRQTHRIFSVDPPGCQDIDDTMHARVLPNGDIEVGVHIADVTYFVSHNSALDKEAQVRGTTFYLVDRRFDMLPSLLSSDLCSLHGNMDRLAVSVIWTFSADLDVVKSCWYGRTVIHNCQAMTYEQAHNILHDKAPDDPSKPSPPPLTAGSPVNSTRIAQLKHDLGILQRLSRKLRKDRETIGGAVDLSGGDVGSELKFVLDARGNPTKVAPKKELEIHHTIAEMMILANQSVAEKIYKSFPESSLLRIHRAVAEDNFEELEGALKAGGIAFDGSSNMTLAKSLEKAKQDDRGNQVVNSLWQSLATRAMSEALYISSGQQEDGVGLSHYGLGIDKYTHFTSPIRRYADIVVHKQLLAALALDSLDSTVLGSEVTDSRLVLKNVPESSAISILKGEGLGGSKTTNDMKSPGDEDDDFLDSLIEGASELALGSDDVNKDTASPVEGKEESSKLALVPYNGPDVSRICEGLNRQNRMAKLSSIECQRLFLSLFFSTHTEFVQAVVTGLRANGLIVYVPKFDLKGPVYLSDINGDVQMDPSFFGLDSDAGLPPTLAFVDSPRCRRFPSGRCDLKGSSEEADILEVSISESSKTCLFRPLDVVSVQISCDLSDIRARIPPPRFHLVSAGLKRTSSNPSVQQKVTSGMIGGAETKVEAPMNIQERRASTPHDPRNGSMHSLLSALDIKPVLEKVPIRRRRQKVRVPVESTSEANGMPGRKVFGGFQNPDTRSATQEAAMTAASEAAAQRREAALASQSWRDEYDTSRAIEREATARTQRLAAQKRSARRAKSKH